MIYIFTAFYWEAHMFIGQFHLKKVLESTHYQQFTDEATKILVTVSGAGEIAAAAAVGSVCTRYPPGHEDVLLNIGICAGDAEKGSIFLIHKLTEQTTGRTFYPDLLYRHRFLEAELVTRMLPWKQRPEQDRQISEPEQDRGAQMCAGRCPCVFDMEGAAVYQAGAAYFAPHQMLFLKLVSDNGEGMQLSGQYVRQLMETHQEEITAFLDQLLQVSGQYPQTLETEPETGRKTQPETGRQSEQMGQWIKKLCTDMHASQTMGNRIGQLIRYAVLTGTDCQAVVERMYRERRLPCRNKREGKQCFEELKQQLL